MSASVSISSGTGGPLPAQLRSFDASCQGAPHGADRSLQDVNHGQSESLAERQAYILNDVPGAESLSDQPLDSRRHQIQFS
jgi:hypothetical protein